MTTPYIEGLEKYIEELREENALLKKEAEKWTKIATRYTEPAIGDKYMFTTALLMCSDSLTRLEETQAKTAAAIAEIKALIGSGE